MTGKTETALRIGVEAMKDYGRTFFYLHNSEQFNHIIAYLRNYQNSIVFCEDIDQVTDGNRDSDMNNLLNKLDGNELKNTNVTFIFTTNNHGNINPAMRRPGRIDQIVHFDYCDEDSVKEIFRLYAEEHTPKIKLDYDAIYKETPPSLQGAVVAEISRRAIGYANRLYDGILNEDRFLDAVASMSHHIEFMRAEHTPKTTIEDNIISLFDVGLGR